MQPEAMSVVDTAWLRMDSPDNLMVINGFWEFDASFSKERFLAIIKERLLAIPRFGKLPLNRDGEYFWHKAEALDLNYHLASVELEGDKSEKDMQNFIVSLISEPLDAGKPLWRFYHIADYQGKSAMVFRIHHAYADGLALVSVFDAIADVSVMSTSPAARHNAPKPAQAKPGALGWLTHQAKQAGTACAFSLGWLYESAHVALLSSDTKTTFKKPLSTDKQVAWAPSISLAEVKDIGKAINCTINDVLLGCVAGSLRRYIEGSGDSADGVSVRATVPMNLRPLSEALNLGNHFGLVYLDLPVSEADSSRRIAKVRRNMSTLKSGMQAHMSYGVLAILGHGPVKLQKAALDFFSQKASAVMTNVPGPTEALQFDGVKISSPMFWVPQSGSIGLGVSILSYAGNVEFGVIADKALVSDPALIVDGFVAELNALRQGIAAGDPSLVAAFSAA